jgi:hypothetical protein
VWAKRCGTWGFGALFNFAEAEVINKLGPIRVSEAHAESYRFRFGVLHEVVERLLAGLVFEYGFTPSRATVLTPTPMGLLPVRLEDTYYQFLLRPGLSFEYAPMSSVYADYQYAVYYNDLDELHHHRFNVGIDHRLLDWLFLRLGGAVDGAGNFGWSAGVGAYCSEWVSVDVGYQFDMLPELRSEFGRSQTFQIAVAIRL